MPDIVSTTRSQFRCPLINNHIPSYRQSNVGAVSRGWSIRLAPDLLNVVERAVAAADLAFKNLLVRLPEVLWQEGVDDRVDGWVAVRQAVRRHPKHEGGLGQWKGSELHPEMNDVMRKPGQAEHHHHHKHCLSCLGEQTEEREIILF